MSKQKITWDDVIIEYIEVFKHCGIFFEEPGGVEPMLSNPDNDDCYSLKGETPETVHERIERSKEAGRNLFFEECSIDEREYEPDTMY